MQGKKRVGARKRGAAECEGQCASEWEGKAEQLEEDWPAAVRAGGEEGGAWR